MANDATALGGSIESRAARGEVAADRSLLRAAATLLIVGEIVYLVMGILHPERENANDHVAVFAEYAASAQWTAIHLGQFIGMAVILAGLVVLFFALRISGGTAGWLARFGAVGAVVTLALYAVLQAVDGVALKQAVNAWASAAGAEKTARFASAETMRWLEWAVRSYQSLLLGATFLLFAAAIVMTARVPRLIGYLMALTGVAYLAQGLIIGTEGFAADNTIPTLAGYVVWIVWSVWLLVLAWRMKETSSPSDAVQP
jgi:hypothetical protein